MAKDLKIKMDLCKNNPKILSEKNSLTLSILSNIITNAIKFSHQSGSIIITSKTNKEYLTLSVKDDGIGMPAELIENLFDPTKKTTRNGTGGERGTGFGMPLVKTFIDKHKAKIEVNSYEGENHGTEFMISFRIWDDNKVSKEEVLILKAS